MGQPDLEALNEPVPTVRSADIRRVWSFLALEKARDPSAQAGIGIDYQVLAQQCNANSNVLAVFLRATLVEGLLQQGLLAKWREGNELRDCVFEVAATFPLPRGLADFDAKAFITALA
jgi:hypothetical protein